MDNLEGLAFGGPAVDYYIDSSLKFPHDGETFTGNLYYYEPSPLEKEIRRIFDRAADKLSKQTA